MALSNPANSLSPREQCGDNHRGGSANNELDLLAEPDNESRSGAAAGRGSRQERLCKHETSWSLPGLQPDLGFSYARPSGRRGGALQVLMMGVATSRFQVWGPLILLCAVKSLHS